MDESCPQSLSFVIQDEDWLTEMLSIEHMTELTHSPAQCRIFPNKKVLKIFKIELEKLK